MTIKIASWNIEGRLSIPDSKKRGSSQQIVSSIKQLNADILVLLEAHTEKSIKDLKSYQQFIDMGYIIQDIPYEDDTALRTDTYTDRLSLIFLSKLPIGKVEIIRLGNLRNAISVVISKTKNNKSFQVIGLHLDDRSEETRIKQIKDLTKIINLSNIPTIVMGDFNSIHGDDLFPAKFLQTKFVRKLAHFIFPKIALKAVEMAQGKALKLLISKTNLSDADPKHQPTATPKMRDREWLPSIRLIQIDHIFVSPEITIKNFQIAPDNGSDHRSIEAEIKIN